MLLAGVRHQWTHGVAWFVKDKTMADRIMKLLHEKCGVMMDVVKVAKGRAGKAVKLVQTDGKKSRAVAACFKLLLKEVHKLTDEDITTSPKNKKVQLEQLRLADECMDRFRELWAELATRMPRPDGTRNGKVPMETIVKKAKLIEMRAFRYRRAFESAYGSGAFKPYTHMTKHLAEQQLRCNGDLIDYNGEATEHSGKEFKQALTQFTNGHKGAAATDGKAKVAGSLELAAMHRECRWQCMEAFPYLLTSSHEKKLKREGTHAKTGALCAPVVKLEAWPETNLAASVQTECRYEDVIKADVEQQLTNTEL
jgi:hypothetical protein